MRTRSASLADIQDFYRQKRLAVVGVSRDEKEFGRVVFRDLRKAGYDVVPVNPAVSEMDGAICHATVTEISPPVDGAMVLLPAAAAEAAVRDCVRAGVPRVWLRNDVPAARELCRERGVTLISGYCPFMFMPGGSFFHQIHAFGLKLAGKYPR